MRFDSGFIHGLGRLAGLLPWLVFPVIVMASSVGEADALRGRVETRWAALVSGDFDRAYEFETPAYRKIYTAQQFRASFGKDLRWKQARVIEIELEQPEVAAVVVEIEYSIPISGRGMMEDKAVDTEAWLRVDGQWWHQLQRVASPAESSKS